jgi:hypothetical protein
MREAVIFREHDQRPEPLGSIMKDPRQVARWMIERTAAAHRAGLDSLFIGDQHVSPAPYYQNTPMLGRLLAEWGNAPAGCLFLLPLWHPVLVAEQTVRWRPSLKAPSSCNGGSAGARLGSPPWAPTSGCVLRLSRKPSTLSGTYWPARR